MRIRDLKLNSLAFPLVVGRLMPPTQKMSPAPAQRCLHSNPWSLMWYFPAMGELRFQMELRLLITDLEDIILDYLDDPV